MRGLRGPDDPNLPVVCEMAFQHGQRLNSPPTAFGSASEDVAQYAAGWDGNSFHGPTVNKIQ